MEGKLLMEHSALFSQGFQLSKAQLHAAVNTCLTPREQRIILLRYGLGNRKPLTQREIAVQCGISRSYVSRIEKRALQKLEDALTKET